MITGHAAPEGEERGVQRGGGGLGCGGCEGLGVTAAVGVWGSFIRQHLHMRML
jgi:hypothetical protein